ncbi:putative diguanylate cyclase YegE [mine drainage metagenome]|uniref:Putative diguanylate cyclase YegE n=1 Tax=mine drainage metagenome TaxID=410659 RepID=A0A1J5RG15_9ZZZZ
MSLAAPLSRAHESVATEALDLIADDTPASALAREQAELILRSIPSAVITTAVVMTALAALLRRYYAWQRIAAWLAFALPLFLARLAIWRRVMRGRALLTRPRACLLQLQGSALLAGLTWAPLPLWFFAGDDLLRMFLTALLLAVASAAMAALAAAPLGALCYMLPVLAPLIVRLMLAQQPLLHAAGWMTVVYIAFLLLVSRRMRAMLQDKSSWRLDAVRRSLTDPLTGLSNRMGFEQRLDAALHRARRHGSGVAVVFIDLDAFKAVNDQHGHAGGDRLLIEFAQRLRSVLRANERPARIGGDMGGHEGVACARNARDHNRRGLQRMTACRSARSASAPTIGNQHTERATLQQPLRRAH